MTSDHTIHLDAANTRIGFGVRWLGVLRVRGHFAELEGTLRIPDGCVDQAEIAIDVMAASVRTGIGLRDHHLRSPQFLDASRHPTISFRSTRIERPNGVLVISGVLTLRGLEREVRATCPVDYANGTGMSALVRWCASLWVPRLPHRVGVARGIDRLNPLLYAIGETVSVRADVFVPATELLPALLPALGP